MEGLGNKEIFSKNLRFYMEKAGKDRNQICDDLGFKYTTFADWYKGNKYPRIDKIEMLANYFGILKSDLIEYHDSMPTNLFKVDLKKVHRIPILGRIAAGTPIYAQENIEGYTPIIRSNWETQCLCGFPFFIRLYAGFECF